LDSRANEFALACGQPGNLPGVRTVSTVNVNGIRAAAGKGFLDRLAATDADVVCVLETRATPDQLRWSDHAPVTVRYRT